MYAITQEKKKVFEEVVHSIGTVGVQHLEHVHCCGGGWNVCKGQDHMRVRANRLVLFVVVLLLQSYGLNLTVYCLEKKLLGGGNC